MYNLIPLLLILVCLIVILVIVVRKFSILANLDIENMPAEKEAKIKEQIISSRLKRNFIKWTSKLMKISKYLLEKSAIFFRWLYNRLIEAKDHYKKEDMKKSPIDKNEKIKELFLEIDDLQKQEKSGETEKRLIEIIGLDARNITAFKMLADLYCENCDYEEAKQTYEHILKLISETENNENEAEINFSLTLIEKARNNPENAIICLKKALKIEPNNPRYLDTMLEISIINKDKILALETYKALEEANPENQKLSELKEQIEKL